MIRRSSVSCYKKFIAALRQSGQGHVAKIMEFTKPGSKFSGNNFNFIIQFIASLWRSSGSALASRPDGPGFEFRGGHMSHA